MNLLHQPHIRSLVLLLLAFAVSSGVLAVVLRLVLPPDEGMPELHLPGSLDELKELGRAVKDYAEERRFATAVAYWAIFVYLQTWSLPGCLYLTIFAGFLFGLPLGLLLVCTGTAVGALGCYMLSRDVAGPTVRHYLGARMEGWREQLEGERGNMFNYIFILRATPVIPNWFINLTSPHLHVAWEPFFFGTFFGVAPPGFVYVQAGKALQTLETISDLMTWGNIGAMLMIGLLAVAPVVSRKLAERRARQKAAEDLQELGTDVESAHTFDDMGSLERGREEEDVEDDEDEERVDAVVPGRWWEVWKYRFGSRGGYELLPSN